MVGARDLVRGRRPAEPKLPLGQVCDPTHEQPQRRARRLTPDQLVELVAGYESGAQAKELATRLRIHRHTVAAVLERAGLQPRQRGLTPSQVDQASQLYDAGWSLARLGGELGVTANTVRRYLLLAAWSCAHRTNGAVKRLAWHASVASRRADSRGIRRQAVIDLIKYPRSC